MFFTLLFSYVGSMCVGRFAPFHSFRSSILPHHPHQMPWQSRNLHLSKAKINKTWRIFKRIMFTRFCCWHHNRTRPCNLAIIIVWQNRQLEVQSRINVLHWICGFALVVSELFQLFPFISQYPNTLYWFHAESRKKNTFAVCLCASSRNCTIFISSIKLAAFSVSSMEIRGGNSFPHSLEFYSIN